MTIAEEELRRVKDATDVVAVINEKVGLKRSSSRWVGLCPFHAEKTPSFSVNPALGVYHCFGCGASGDAIQFLREKEGLTFVEAVERLAARAGIQLTAEDPEAAKARQRRSTLVDAMEKAVAWYHERLLGSPDGSEARGYLRSRGYDGEVVRRYRLGWAPAGWDTMAAALRLPDDVLRGTGLGFVNESGRRSDSFRERVLFPIFDHQGTAIGLGGRQLPGGRPPKYKNTTETSLYRKSEVLYGLNWAKEGIIRHGIAVLCEGYTDVIAFHRAGVEAAVATCGTAVTEDHIRRLKNFGATRLVLGYDADAAGQGAAARFHAWEQSHDLDIRVAALPPGADPADVGREDPDALRRAVEEAVPFLAFRLHRVWAGADLSSREGRARAAEEAMQLVAQHPNPVVYDQYLFEVAARTHIDPERLRQTERERAKGASPAAAASSGRNARPVRPAARRAASLPAAEKAALWFAVNRPEAVVTHLEEELFDHEVAVSAFRALSSAPTFNEAVASADEDVASLLSRLANEPETGDDPLDVITKLARLRSVEALATARRLLQRGDIPEAELAAGLRAVPFLQKHLAALDDPRHWSETLDELVPWLVSHQREG
jgi:DNA primase